MLPVHYKNIIFYAAKEWMYTDDIFKDVSAGLGLCRDNVLIIIVFHFNEATLASAVTSKTVSGVGSLTGLTVTLMNY